jgi:transposase
MTQIKLRKERIDLTIEQKLDYAKLMVHERYTNKKIMVISGACSSAVSRWKKQYLAELNGKTPESGQALTSEQQKIQLLEKQLWRSQRDNEILKKATALFVKDNPLLT